MMSSIPAGETPWEEKEAAQKRMRKTMEVARVSPWKLQQALSGLLL